MINRIKNLMQQIDIKQFDLKQMNQREQFVLLGGGAFVILFVLIVFILMPLAHTRTALASSIKSKEVQLQKVYEISGKIKALERTSRANSGNNQGMTLFGYLEDLAKKQGVSERIEYMKPVTGGPGNRDTVEVRIKGMYREEFVSMLYGIENAPMPLAIGRLNVRRVDKDKNLDVTLQVRVNG